ncbi:MAG: hypothetical protein K2G15_06060, partial [Muribaculaceae bacterium]|nr:hypothetical protein [Muribaculaceae bacterium]
MTSERRRYVCAKTSPRRGSFLLCPCATIWKGGFRSAAFINAAGALNALAAEVGEDAGGGGGGGGRCA